MPPPSAQSGYTFEDFLKRLERSPTSHMAPLYQDHRELFVHRPDMFTKAVMSIQWEKALGLVQAAYYSQPITADTYRAVLARMLLHNKHVRQQKSGSFVSWRAALHVFSEAVVTHGAALPTRMHVSALRLLAPAHQWLAAIRVLQLGQANDQLTKPMLVDAAAVCANEVAWEQALKLLMHIHTHDPVLLTETIQSLRPPGSDALTASQSSANSLYGDGSLPGAPTAAQMHIIRTLNEVVAAVPSSVALGHPLCHSYLTHLIASTSLTPEVKTQLLTSAIEKLPWQAALKMLMVYTEPNLLEDDEWEEVAQLGPSSSSPEGTSSSSSSQKRGNHMRKKKKGSKSKSIKSEGTEELKGEREEPLVDGTVDEDAAALAVVVEDTSSLPAIPAVLGDRLELLKSSPSTVAALVAVLVRKFPTSRMSFSFVQKSASGMLRHSVVLHALLGQCAVEKDGWRLAVPLILQYGTARVEPVPTDVLSTLVLQLREARQVSLLVRLLQEYVVPRQCTLSNAAMCAMYEAILAHNKAVHRVAQEEDEEEALAATRGGEGDYNDDREAALSLMQQKDRSGVHWLSALSWATKMQAATKEDRILVTGTGNSLGAVSQRPAAVEEIEKPLSTEMLQLVVHICAEAGSPQGALRAMGYARKVDKTEMPLSDEVRAVLYCMLYDRPYEAEAIVAKATKEKKEAETASLRLLLQTAREAKLREERKK